MTLTEWRNEKRRLQRRLDKWQKDWSKATMAGEKDKMLSAYREMDKVALRMEKLELNKPGRKAQKPRKEDR